MSGDSTVDSIPVQPITWLAAQKRPFIAATIAALLFVLLIAAGGVIHGDPRGALSFLLWPGPLLYVAIAIPFLLPLWLVQLIIYIQMWQQGRPYFVSTQSASLLERERQCHFVLYLRPMMFVLSVLYVETRARERYWMRPTWLYLSICAVGLLAFCLLSIYLPLAPPLFIISAVIFWISAFIFGLGHLVVGA